MIKEAKQMKYKMIIPFGLVIIFILKIRWLRLFKSIQYPGDLKWFGGLFLGFKWNK